jgi:hypothetical protein
MRFAVKRMVALYALWLLMLEVSFYLLDSALADIEVTGILQREVVISTLNVFFFFFL